MSHTEGTARVAGAGCVREGGGTRLVRTTQEGRATRWKRSQLAALPQPLPTHLLQLFPCRALPCHIVLTSVPSFELQGGSVEAVVGDGITSSRKPSLTSRPTSSGQVSLLLVLIEPDSFAAENRPHLVLTYPFVGLG